MFWIFVILGSLTLMVVLHGLVTTWHGPPRVFVFHLAALFFIILAMQQTHNSTLGRMALVCGLAAEVVAGFTRRSRRDKTTAGAESKSILIETVTPETITPDTRQQAIESIEESEPEVDEASDHPSEMDKTESHSGEETQEPIQETPPPDSPKDSEPDPEPSESSDENADAPTLETPSTDDPSAEDDFPSEAIEESASPRPAPDPPATVSDEPVTVVEHEFTTVVLLERTTTMSGEVFLASLRRSGQRDAKLTEPSEHDSAIRVKADRIRLDICSFAEPWQAADESFMPPDTDPDAPLQTHKAFTSITSVFESTIARDDIIRLHHRAHAALAEFAPAIAAVWPAAGRVVTAAELESLRSQANDASEPMAKTCTRLRSFDLDGPAAGMVLCDTLGLTALGLPDIQLIVEKASDDAIQQIARDLADRFLESGCDLENGSEFILADDRTCRITHTWSAFSPDREAIQFVAKP